MSQTEKGRRRQLEIDIWDGVIIGSMWRVYIICMIVELAKLAVFQAGEEYSVRKYLAMYFLIPSLIQGALLLFLKFFICNAKERCKDLTLDLVSVIICNLFAGVTVFIHCGVQIVGVALIMPISLLSVYRRRGLIRIQLLITIFLYCMLCVWRYLDCWSYPPETIIDNMIVFIAMACAYAVIEEQVRKSSLQRDAQVWKDSLTQLYNHEAFYEELENYMEKFKTDREHFSILVADIDNFKSVNDTYGHAYGDEVIRAVARVMSENCGSRDFAARYGGEEFAMILPGKLVSEAVLTADKVRRDFASCSIVSKDGPKSFTISIGVAEYTKPYRTSSSFFEEADNALYRAKADGKNRVCCKK